MALMEVKAQLAGFLGEVAAMQDAIFERINRQEEKMTMLEHRMTETNRPPLGAAEREEAPHRKAFAAYVRAGDDSALKALGLEGKGMVTSVAADGGYLVDPQTAERIEGVLRGASSLRQVAKVVQVESGSFDVLIDHADIGAGWGTEAGPVAETATPQIDRISVVLHELSAMPKVSQRLLDDSAFDIEGWLAERIGDKFARAESAAFISGDGVDKPTGFLAHPQVDNAGWSWGNIGYIPTGVAGDFDATRPADVIVDLVYALGARYRANGTFVMNSKTAGVVRKMKDVDGRFLWSDGLAAQEPARLMGYPVVICEDMPDIATGATAIAFGDFNAGYTIAERPDMRILRDPFSAKPHVLFYATRRVGGDVTDFAAIKLLKFDVA